MSALAYMAGKAVDLEPLSRDDWAECMVRWANDGDATHFMVTGNRPTTRDQTVQMYDGLMAEGAILFGIRARETGDLVGHVGLYALNWVPRHAELRILIGEDYGRGKGWGTEATRMVIAYGFERLNLNKVWLGVNADNVAGVCCYEKAGMTREGTLRAEIFRNGRYYDAIRLSILRDEYLAARE
ncbi:MAG TPA: GNAT family N-acetyltransferase [Magnetospirillum sp.]|jgi:RimJ/RimL family protein N-acetyltransferase|nr:GNAT family N-acetyltransferase [Magnetospirillum sp.]